ncbi:hypothetical protein Hamer_G022867 [Homarus americanus]|uniref:HAT C-terminal dimerisation domain-containing protein n=1 Tax=Homarus americanus TaxID=6706 RepID=A0A8J5K302_HOMAM|nr:hypothetical protein Hamer_G022867 [Homarus americanus]
MPSMLPLMNTFPRISPTNKQQLDNEWRAIDNIKFPDYMKNQRNTELFYKEMSSMKDDFGEPYFRELPYFTLKILSLPTSNVDVERIFSKVNLTKTKQRNILSTQTLTSLIIPSEMVLKCGGCVSYEPSENWIRFVKNPND